MTTSEFNNKAKTIKENEKMIKELQKINDELKDEIKLSMLDMGMNEVLTGTYKIRFTDTVTERFNQKLFQSDYPELYAKYLKKTAGSRFSIY
jgi:predicted phage-related endonuclease